MSSFRSRHAAEAFHPIAHALGAAEHSVIYMDESGSVALGNPPTASERKFMSLIKILGFHINGALSFENKVTAMKPIIHFFITGMEFSFCSVDGNHVSNVSRIAEAAVGWMCSSPDHGLSPDRAEEIEDIVLRQQHGKQGEVLMAEAVASNVSSSSSGRVMHYNPPREGRPDPKRRRESKSEASAVDGLEPEPACSGAECSDAGTATQNEDLFVVLERIQRQIGHRPENDVHRGKGQGVKNVNARLYTPLIASRAMEYSGINGNNGRNKRENYESKHTIALEVLIELARVGGRIRDVDNTTVLDNRMALKKVMNALKDKSREIKKKGTCSALEIEEVQLEDTISLARRTAENVELLKMLRRSSSNTEAM